MISPSDTDAELRRMLQDPRYRDNWRPGSAAYRAEVTRAWEERYPGAARMDATGRLVRVSGYQRSVEVNGTQVTQQVSGYVQTRNRSGGAAGNPSHVDRFFDIMHAPLQAASARLNLPPEYILGLSSYESGWLNSHNTGLNNPLGLTRGGANNLRFQSNEAAVRYWERLYGEQVRGSTSAEDFVDRLRGQLNGQPVPGWRVYNTINANWRTNVLDNIRTVQRRLPLWRPTR